MKRRLWFLGLMLASIFSDPVVQCQELTVQTDTGKLVLSRTDLEALTHVKVTASEHSTGPVSFEGVTLKSVLEKAGVMFGESLKGKQLTSCLLVEGADGYRVVIALPELDPAFTDKRIVLAFSRDGKPLDEKEGPYRIVIPDEKRMARWVKQVIALRILTFSEKESIFLNHHLGRFYHCRYSVPLLEFELVSAATGNGTLDQVLPDANDDMGHDVPKLDLFDFSAQFISS